MNHNEAPIPADDDKPTVPLGPLADVAAQLRAGGACLAALGAGGSLDYVDADAPPFFAERVWTPLSSPAVAARLAALAESLDDDARAAPATWAILPGVALAAVRVAADRRGGPLTLLVAAEAPRAGAGPSVHGDADVVRQARLAASAVRDKCRVAALEDELRSLSGQLSNTYEELSLIYQLSSGMTVNRGAADFFRQACADVTDVIGAGAMGVALTAANLDATEPALYGELELSPIELRRLTSQLVPVLAERNAPLLVNHVAADERFGWLAGRVRNLLAVPLQRQGHVLGCLFGLDKQGGDFDSVDAKLLNSIANESAIFLENATLFADLNGLVMGLLHSLTSAVDAKDAYTCGHSHRVARVSRDIAVRLGMPPAEAERIYIAGLLHDVGKIGVPEAVLQKTGKLTAEEFEQMKKHPEVGARILQDIKQINDVLPGVMHHHERYDGRGYPAGLSGGDIPLMGRIICLADCFDAMTSNRTYRKALPLEVALTELRRCAGTQFDPAVAEAFLSIGIDGLRELLLGPDEPTRLLTVSAHVAPRTPARVAA